jgi:hypothetical protein
VEISGTRSGQRLGLRDLALSVNTAQIRHEGTEACIGEE